MALSWPNKDPDEVEDFDINWAGPDDEGFPGRTFGDAILSSEWIITGSVVKDSDTFSDGVTKIWLSGGSLGETCLLTNRVTTVGGRTFDQSVKLRIRAK
jgi:hypothetical protein